MRRVQIVLGGTFTRADEACLYLEPLRLSDLAEKLIEHEEIMYRRRLPFVRRYFIAAEASAGPYGRRLAPAPRPVAKGERHD